MDEKRWKLIEDYPNYEISSHGDIRNTFTGETLLAGTHKNGRLRVNLRYLGEPTHFYVHRLVAKHFLPGWREGIGVIAKDGDYLNCRVDNLYYKGNVVVKRDPSLHVKNLETEEVFVSIAAAARAINGQATNVRRVLEGTLRHHKGFTFMYVREG